MWVEDNMRNDLPKEKAPERKRPKRSGEGNAWSFALIMSIFIQLGIAQNSIQTHTYGHYLWFALSRLIAHYKENQG